ncbi:sensor histidine kinase [Microbacteriaceae bacterium 4G12]
MTNTLKNYVNQRNNRKLDIQLIDKNIEELAFEINYLIEHIAQANIDKTRTENELKQAISNISHDLRTPLTSIIGYIQFLELPETTTAEKEHYLAIVKNKTKRLQTLVNDFFELSVIDSIDYHLNPQLVKMNHLTWEILVGFYDQFSNMKMEPTICIQREEIQIMADESAIKRVMENLINNALNHASGNIAITLKREASSVIFMISNDVENVSQQDIPLLFDRFYTTNHHRDEKGTGLGLSIAKTLMLKMNGSLQAELKEGRLHMICRWKIED